MNNTLDSIRPSDKNHTREEMSYLFGRDPSILSYGQRPCPSQETKKNLLSAYEIEFDSAENITSLLSDTQSLKTIKVYLRLKPFPRKIKLLPEQEKAYEVINSTTLATKLPCLENNSSFARSKNSEITSRTYTFTQTFGPEITQLELFDQAIKQQMFDFLAGQSCNVMTYGMGYILNNYIYYLDFLHFYMEILFLQVLQTLESHIRCKELSHHLVSYHVL